MKAKIIPDMPFADYTAAPGINASMLKVVHQYSLAHALAYRQGTFAKKSDALDFGRAFHSLALEGEHAYTVRPAVYNHPKEGEKPWNAGANACKEWLASHDGAYIISAADCDALLAMNEAVQPHLHFEHGGQSELSVFAERDGLPVKVRIDFLPSDDDQPVIDLKTCRNAHPEIFMRDALRLGYHIQAAWTLDLLRKVGVKRREFRLIAVEDKPPYAVCVLRFRDEAFSALRMGRRRANALYAQIIEAERTGRWDSYGVNDAEEFVPAWYKEELEATA